MIATEARPQFNATGKAIADFGKRDYAHSVAVQSDGKIVVAVMEHGDGRIFAVARFMRMEPDISLTDGTDYGFRGANAEVEECLQSDGKIVVAGFELPMELKIRAGTVQSRWDTGHEFGGTGKVLTCWHERSNATAWHCRRWENVVAGYAINNSGRDRDFAIVRYNADGSSTRVLRNGKVTTAVSDEDGHCEALRWERMARSCSRLCFMLLQAIRGRAVRRRRQIGPELQRHWQRRDRYRSRPSEAEDTAPRASMAELMIRTGTPMSETMMARSSQGLKKGTLIAAKPWNRLTDPNGQWLVRYRCIRLRSMKP